MTIHQRIEDKKWIKPGTEVAHRDFPDRKMIAEEVIKQTKEMKINGVMEKKVLTVGVWCHWFDASGRYDRGRFLTMELIPFGAKTIDRDPDSFPEEIPKSNEIPENQIEEDHA